MLDILIFDVELGQCIFFYPHNNTNYGMLVDCGHKSDFYPTDFLIDKGFLPFNRERNKYVLSNLTLTNYDHDHFSGLPRLLEKIHIDTVRFPKNLQAFEIWNLKPIKTDALKNIKTIRETYTSDTPYHTPPYRIFTHHLEKSHFPDNKIDTNNLSQIVCFEYLGTNICVAGDLEKQGWDLMLKNPLVQEELKKTDIFVAAHHGRNNGYVPEIFNFCAPECVIISDQTLMYDTQKSMAQTYGNHLSGNGIVLNTNINNPRKVLTTRSDGHLWLRINTDGSRVYKSF